MQFRPHCYTVVSYQAARAQNLCFCMINDFSSPTNIGMLSIDILLTMAAHDMLNKQGIIPADIMTQYFFHQIKMASAVAMMIGSAVVNASVFTGGNFLFSKLDKSNVTEKERETCDKAVEQLEVARTALNKSRVQQLDFINEAIKKEHHAGQTFGDVDQAMKQYCYITSKQLGPVPPEPKLTDDYTASQDQQTIELLFIALGTKAARFVVYKILWMKNVKKTIYF